MKRQALVVGINQYPFLADNPGDKTKNLLKPATDAEAIAQCLETFGDFEVHRLPTQEGKRQVDPKGLVKIAQLEAAIIQLFHPQGNNIPQTGLLFFAGHGLQRNQDGETEGFLATSEASPRKDKWGISLKWLRKILEKSPVRQQLIWLDCCHSGELFNFSETDLGEYLKGRDRSFIAASREFQSAYGGVLTPALLQGLDPTQLSDGCVTNYTLKEFIEQALKDAPQHPILTNTGGQILLTGKQGVRATICPYKGLAYFDLNDSDPQYFHGRAALTNQLLEKVEQSNFLAVLGASGSGKSSVVRAGLLHQLKQGTKPGSDGWKIYPPFTPSEHPFRSLEQAIGVEAKQFEALIDAAAAERVVLVVDQFEEAFTLCRDNGERQQFFECLMGAVKQLGNKLCLVLVMRADFFGKCAEQEYAGLAKAIEQNLVTVLPMTQQELREAIIKPAEKVGLEVERELVTQMIADVEGSPGNLPLLQYTLTELWQQKSLNRLVLSEYTRLGGVKEALEKHANKVYETFSIEEQQIAKWIFLSLTRLGEETEDTRRQVRQQDLITSLESEALIEQVIQRLAEAKLVVIQEKEFEGKRVSVVDITHEALIRHWQRLRDWLKENQKALIRKQDIDDAAQAWRDKGKPKDSAYLLQGPRLAEAENYLQTYAASVPLSNLSQEFVQRSIKRRRDNLIRLVSTVTGVIVSLTGLTIFANIQRIEANRQRIEADKQRVEADKQRVDAQLIASSLLSDNLLNSNKQLEGLIEAIRAGKLLKESDQKSIEVKPETKNRVVIALQQAVYGLRERNRLEGHNNEVRSVILSPDNKMIASAGGDKTIKLWARDGTLIRTIEVKEASDIVRLSFSPDSKMIVAGINGIDPNKFDPNNPFDTASNIYEVKLWSIDGTLLKNLKGHTFYISSVKFSPDSKMIASSSADKTVKIWSIDGRLLKTIQHKDYVKDVSFSPDGKNIGSVVNNTAKIWNMEGKELKTLKGNPGWIGSIDFSPNGKMIALLDVKGIVKLWSTDGRELKTFQAHEGSSFSRIVFSPDSKIIASIGGPNIKIWSIDGILIETFKGNNTAIHDVTFSPDGKMIASAGGADGSIRLWEIKSTKPQTLSSRTTKISFSPDSNTIALASDKEVKLYSRNGNLLKTFKGHSSRINDVSFSPDGKTIASVSGYTDILEAVKDFVSAKRGLLEQPQGFVEIIKRQQSRNDRPYDRSIKLWSINGSLLRSIDITIRQAQYQGHGLGVASICFSPDSKMIVSSDFDQTVMLWSIAGTYGTPLQALKGNNMTWGFSFSPDGKTLAAAIGKNVELMGIGNKEIKTLRGHNDDIKSIAFSPNGQLIASASLDKTVKIWKRDGTLLKTINGYKSGIRDLSFSPDGQRIATASGDGIHIWNLSGQLLTQFADKMQFTVGINFDWDEEKNALIVTKVHKNSPASKAGVKKGDRVLTIDGEPATNMSLYSPKIVVGKAGTTLLLKLSRQDDKPFNVLITREVFSTESNSYSSVNFSPDGKTIATASNISTVSLWTFDGKFIKTLGDHRASVLRVRFSPNGQLIASASFDKTVKLWNINGQLIKTLDGHSDKVTDISFSPDGKMLASASNDGIVRLWKTDGTLVKPLLGNSRSLITGNASSVHFSPDGKTLVLGNDSDVEFWNPNGSLLKVLAFRKRVWFTPDGNVKTSDLAAIDNGHTTSVNSVNFSPDGKVLASASFDKTVKLWSFDGTLLKTLKNIDFISDVRFSPDGKTLASAGFDQTVRLWNLEGTLLRTLRGHNGLVNNVTFSPNGSLLASGSVDKTIKLWSNDGTLLKTFNSDGLVNDVSFSPDGKILAFVNFDKVTLLNFDLDNLMVRSCYWVRDYLKTNPNVSESDRHLCDRIESSDP